LVITLTFTGPNDRPQKTPLAFLGTGKNKQPYAIAMKSGEPFALAALWENWKDPATGENIRTFTVLTCEPNPLGSVANFS
jgi:putative SOS response-associated peptidase YedK